MKRLPLHRSKQWLTGAAAGLATWSGGERLAAAPRVGDPEAIRRAAPLGRFAAGYEGVLGTSLDLWLEAARPSDAAASEAALRAEIERLRTVLSTYDPASDIRRAMAGGPVNAPELAELLAEYETWAARTGGLVDANLGGVIATWREAARTGRLPERAELAAAAQRARAWNVDALGKGFVIERAVAAARRYAPGGLVNLGGDIRAWGDSDWTIAVADPRQPADNAPALAHFTLREAAVATSGGYARFFEVGGRRFSHLIDPRTQWPLAAAGGATIMAPDCVTANALSTAASIGGAEMGAELARTHGAAGWLFADGAGRVTGGGMLTEALATADAAAGPAPTQPNAGGASEKSAPATPAAAATWPDGFQVVLQVMLKKHESPPEVYRPYVAMWVENVHGVVVRTLTSWGTDQRWQGKLSMWSYQTRNARRVATAVSRATRNAGSYAVTWDGLDDYQRHLPPGSYKISLEIAREQGAHILEEVTLELGGPEPVSGAFRATRESEPGTVVYGPAKS